MLAVPLPVCDLVPVALSVGTRDADDERLPLWERLGDFLEDGVLLGERLPLNEGETPDGVTVVEQVRVRTAVQEPLVVNEADGILDPDLETLCEGLPVCEPNGEGVTDRVGTNDSLAVREQEAVRERVEDGDSDKEVLQVWNTLSDRVMDAVAGGDRLPVRDGDANEDTVGDLVTVGQVVADLLDVSDPERVMESDRVEVCDGLPVWDSEEHVADQDGVRDSLRPRKRERVGDGVAEDDAEGKGLEEREALRDGVRDAVADCKELRDAVTVDDLERVALWVPVVEWKGERLALREALTEAEDREQVVVTVIECVSVADEEEVEVGTIVTEHEEWLALVEVLSDWEVDRVVLWNGLALQEGDADGVPRLEQVLVVEGVAELAAVKEVDGV